MWNPHFFSQISLNSLQTNWFISIVLINLTLTPFALKIVPGSRISVFYPEACQGPGESVKSQLAADHCPVPVSPVFIAHIPRRGAVNLYLHPTGVRLTQYLQQTDISYLSLEKKVHGHYKFKLLEIYVINTSQTSQGHSWRDKLEFWAFIVSVDPVVIL